ncbi:MAG: hypothetical protein COA52_17375 [Hyphomicrobiales bacterium]|nr:MAG: hypothetical protein COA52_17375 [Hyphomicrobiales bacterium]
MMRRAALIFMFVVSFMSNASSNIMDNIFVEPKDYMINLQNSFQEGLVMPSLSLTMLDHKYIIYLSLDEGFVERGAKKCVTFIPAFNRYGIKKQFEILGIEYESEDSILYKVLIDKVVHHFGFRREWGKNGPLSWKIDSMVYEAKPRRRDYTQDWSDCFMQHIQ